MSLKRARSPSPAGPDSTSTTSPLSSQIYISSPISDRSSIFVAHFSPSLPRKSLQSHPDFTSASHRIAAWRMPSRQRALKLSPSEPASSASSGPLIYETGFDDDGEKHSGKKLEKLLVDMNIAGSVVVARWYGGILLGPVRFLHIENCARDAIGKWAQESKSQNQEASKKRRVEAQEEEDKKRLVRELPERDNSIAVLRTLLSEKQSQGTKESSQGLPTAASKTIDYGKMPLVALKRLDKARDATITWLLKEIDNAEVEEKELEEAFKEAESSQKLETEPESEP